MSSVSRYRLCRSRVRGVACGRRPTAWVLKRWLSLAMRSSEEEESLGMRALLHPLHHEVRELLVEVGELNTYLLLAAAAGVVGKDGAAMTPGALEHDPLADFKGCYLRDTLAELR